MLTSVKSKFSEIVFLYKKMTLTSKQLYEVSRLDSKIPCLFLKVLIDTLADICPYLKCLGRLATDQRAYNT